ncbi:MAG: CPBP family intramembrane metalloprotease [Acidimicrobiia bacterium]|nr:CPBP family intramembrane metalloprotease [Acidimicrobiia bacterium]
MASPAGLRSELKFGPAERDASIVLLTVMGVLIASNYLGSGSDIGWLVNILDAVGLDGVGDRLEHAMDESVHRRFNRRVYFAVFRMFVYLVPALLVGRWVLRRPMRDLGWRLGWGWAHLRVYVVLYGLMLPLVLLASTQQSFQDTYPFYTPNQFESVWPWFVVWELLYLGQFIALELFFRGFGVHGLAPRLGIMAVPVMVVPYVAIHFGKPMPEAIGSIVAGAVLGVVSLRQGGAFWGGVLHWSVAITIDVLAY